MALRLDHVPFYGKADDLLVAFANLGFLVSPLGSYTSPQYPDALWETNCVFMKRGWFDLLRIPTTKQSNIGIPGGCLFFADDLEAAINVLPAVAIADRYELERCWTNNDDREHFELVTLHQSPCSLPVSIICHHWPCDDLDASWTEHPNGAVCLQGVFCRSDSDEIDTRNFSFQSILDVSQAVDVPKPRFVERFHSDGVAVAIQVGVSSLREARRQFDISGIRTEVGTSSVLAFPESLACIFEFVEIE